MDWKLVLVAAAVLALAAPPALAQANISAPVIEIAPPGHSSDSIPSMRGDIQPKASQGPPLSPANLVVRHATVPHDATQERRLSPGAILGLICAIAASSMALGIAFGLRRRIDRIAGPDPDKADDD